MKGKKTNFRKNSFFNLKIIAICLLFTLLLNVEALCAETTTHLGFCLIFDLKF